MGYIPHEQGSVGRVGSVGLGSQTPPRALWDPCGVRFSCPSPALWGPWGCPVPAAPSAGPDPKPTLSAQFLSSLPQLCGTGHRAASPFSTETERTPPRHRSLKPGEASRGTRTGCPRGRDAVTASACWPCSLMPRAPRCTQAWCTLLGSPVGSPQVPRWPGAG